MSRLFFQTTMFTMKKAAATGDKDPDANSSNPNNVRRSFNIVLDRKDVLNYVYKELYPKCLHLFDPKSLVYEKGCYLHGTRPIPFVLEYAKRTEDREWNLVHKYKNDYEANPTSENYERFGRYYNAFPSSVSLHACELRKSNTKSKQK